MFQALTLLTQLDLALSAHMLTLGLHGCVQAMCQWQAPLSHLVAGQSMHAWQNLVASQKVESL